MKMIDTHSHLYAAKLAPDIEEVVTRAQEVLSHCFLPNIDLASVAPMHALVERAPDFFYPMMGLHPCSAKEDQEAVLDEMEGLLEAGNYVGIGETGLDYYWDTTHVEQQKAALRRQITWARELQLPLILHCRDSMEDVMDLVEEGQDGRLFGIFHCFNGTLEQGQRIRDLGFVMGIGGVLTYKNSGVAEVVAQLPLESLVLETDAPYLTPVPHRGKRNESSYIPIIGRKLSDVMGMTIPEVARATSANALRVFRMDS